jgi:hypothetical protein
LVLPDASGTEERRRLGDEILHGTGQLLLIANPLGRAAERRGDLIDPLR